MKGKDTFTQSEISELKSLIKVRIGADRNQQKSIRAKMRKIGFYSSDDFGMSDLQPLDFENLIKSNRIRVLEESQERKNKTLILETNLEKKKENVDIISNEFKKFDPMINDSYNIPDNSGNYIICLRKGSSLPTTAMKVEIRTFQDLKVIYTGIAGKSLRKRDFRQHFTGNNAGSSTLRKSLGSLFGYPKIPRDKIPNNGKTKFIESDEIKLSNWMKSNLILFFKSNPSPERLEEELIGKFNPPLNLSKNRNIINLEFRKELSRLRNI